MFFPYLKMAPVEMAQIFRILQSQCHMKEKLGISGPKELTRPGVNRVRGLLCFLISKTAPSLHNLF